MGPHSASELIQAAGAVIAAAQLFRLGLVKPFRALLAYLVFLAFINVDFGLQPQTTKAYFYSYVTLEPLKCILSVFAVRELFALTFENYPGIRAVGRWAIYAGVALAIGISLAATIWGGRAHGISKLYYFEVAQRWVVFTLAFVIAAILWCLSRYPLHLRANTLTSSAFFSALFLGDAVRLLIDSMTPHYYNHYVDRPESVFAFVCLLVWAFLLKPEDAIAPARITFSTPREDYLLEQLTALNQVMNRAARR